MKRSKIAQDSNQALTKLMSNQIRPFIYISPFCYFIDN